MQAAQAKERSIVIFTSPFGHRRRGRPLTIPTPPLGGVNKTLCPVFVGAFAVWVGFARENSSGILLGRWYLRGPIPSYGPQPVQIQQLQPAGDPKPLPGAAGTPTKRIQSPAC